MTCLKAAAVFISALFVAGAAQAQDTRFNPNWSLNCYYESNTQTIPDACIGRSANRCMEVTPSGYSNRVMAACLKRETKLWDGLLNASYQSLRGNDRQTDAASGGNRAIALRDMQRAWIAFRDASCKYEYSQWAGGSGAGTAHASCVMNMTGRQAMVLDTMLAQNLAN